MMNWKEGIEWLDPVECRVDVSKPITAGSLAAAWALLPNDGTGWVALTDTVERFSRDLDHGKIIQQAEVVTGMETVRIRQDGNGWIAHIWTEGKGDPCRRVTWRYESSAPIRKGGGAPPRMVYHTYWRREATPLDGGPVDVWVPFGSRFAGWEE